MKKLKLIIADVDNYYVQNLVKYILLKYSQSFEIHSFTTPEYIEEHLYSSNGKADILLLGKEFITESVSDCKQGITVLLSEEEIYRGKKELSYVYKYQYVEKLITELIAIYSGCDSKCFVPNGKGTSHMIAIFSAVGGSGKTSIAACSSVLCARRGGKVLYLNLEAICSTPAFFSGTSSRTFSNVIYYLKENSSNLAAKIEGARCVDPDTGVYFFKPAESIQDIEELLYGDTELLLDTLKRSACYDVIFIDLSCGLSARNIAALKACDSIMSIAAARMDTAVRDNLLQMEYEILQEKFDINMARKCIPVTNMYRSLHTEKDRNAVGFYPEMEQQFLSAYTGCQGFNNDVGRILDFIFKGQDGQKNLFTLSQDSFTGGESLAK